MNLISYIAIIIIVTLSLFFLLKMEWWQRLKRPSASRERTILEDILKSLYASKRELAALSVKELSKQLPFAEQQIVTILDRMQETNLVWIEENQVQLSAEGEEYALRIIRAHRLWEHYLAEKTGYNKKDWHKLAEKQEHKLSEERLEELSKELKRPLFDPHGSPIPYGKNSIKNHNGKSLNSFPEGTIGRIIEIEDEPYAIYKQIIAENIHLGAQVEILESNAQEICFFSEGKQHRLSKLVANALTIIPLEKEEITEQLDRLSRLKIGETATVKGISRECRGENRRRLLDLGFVTGTEISISSISPLKDPTAYQLRNTMIALRSEQAQYVLIEKKKDDE